MCPIELSDVSKFDKSKASVSAQSRLILHPNKPVLVAAINTRRIVYADSSFIRLLIKADV